MHLPSIKLYTFSIVSNILLNFYIFLLDLIALKCIVRIIVYR